VLLAIILVACSSPTPKNPTNQAFTDQSLPPESPTPVSRQSPIYLDSTQLITARVDDLLGRMTLEEKIGQMTQVEKDSIAPGDITKYFIGSILSGGGGSPDNNTVESWQEMTAAFQDEALATRLSIPLIYGVDAVHGHGNLYGATIFPHQIGLGATGDSDLVRQIGQATAKELLATGISWNFAPVVAVPLDVRWGRTYEAYGQDKELVAELGLAYMQGLQSLPDGYTPAPGQSLYTLATPKHFLGDGGTVFGSSSEGSYLLDQGDMRLDEATVRDLFLPPYQLAVENGANSIMASYNSWNGTKMHANEDWLTEVLKNELGFAGFVVSDWGALNQIDFDYYKAVVTGINAGIDMNMVPTDYKTFINTMLKAVESGDISLERIDDAASRILRVKFELGLFDNPYGDPELATAVGSDTHRELARQAVRQSLVLLKDDDQTLPFSKETSLIYVAGRGASDIGLQSGGWTITWQGRAGDVQPGTTILDGIRSAVSPSASVQYDADGMFDSMADGKADVAIVVVGEFPYAEGAGDKADLGLSKKDIEVIQNSRAHSERLVVVILSGRPLIITDQLQDADAWVAAWLPGSEGQGIADVLFGDYPFTGKLPVSWPRSMDQVPIDIGNSSFSGCQGPLFPIGYGLDSQSDGASELPDCY
jgi:beta-glucosidase